MDIEKIVKETIKEHDLCKREEKILVALSGGKDSTVVLYVLHKLGYNVEGLMIDLDLGEWSKIHSKNMTDFCNEYNIKLHIIELREELGQGICFIKSVLRKKEFNWL